MVESGMTEGEKNTASFLFREWTQQHKHEVYNLKETEFSVTCYTKPLESVLLQEENGLI